MSAKRLVMEVFTEFSVEILMRPESIKIQRRTINLVCIDLPGTGALHTTMMLPDSDPPW